MGKINISLDDKTLYDKMRGGWLGKNIGGTLGGPLEGQMKLLDINFYVQEFDGPMENDDLDLQLVNLHCLEQYGPAITVKHLASEWLSHVFFPFDEYGHALSNMRKGLTPPLSGRYDNYFTDCMGSPIRSEIWAMVAPGDPDLASYYALQDSLVDHAGGEGMQGEIFFAALESLAFIESDIDTLINEALKRIPADSFVYKAVSDVLKYHKKGLNWKEAREKIIESYAGDNFTYAPPNIAFTVIGLLYGKGFSDSICIACNCGYDTDCTTATLGSILGIINGEAGIPKKWIEPIGENIAVSKPVNGFNYPADITELTDRTFKMQQIIKAYRDNASPNIGGQSSFSLDFDVDKIFWTVPENSFSHPDLTAYMTFEDNSPTLNFENTKEIRLTLQNCLSDKSYTGNVSLDLPAGIDCAQSEDCLNSFEFSLKNGERREFVFTLSPLTALKERYRCRVIINRENQEELWSSHSLDFTLLPQPSWNVSLETEDKKTVFCKDSAIDFSSVLNTTVKGNYYAETSFVVSKEKDVDFVLATEYPCKLYLDDNLVFECDDTSPFIPAYHRSDYRKRGIVTLKSGRHDIILVINKADDLALSPVILYPVQCGEKQWNALYSDIYFDAFKNI